MKHNLHVENLGDPPPPKGDPVFELKQLPDTLKYAYLDEKKIYPHLYKGVDGVIRCCVPEHEQEQILRKCHSESYEGHHAGDRTAHKVLQSGFYWPTDNPQV